MYCLYSVCIKQGAKLETSPQLSLVSVHVSKCLYNCLYNCHYCLHTFYRCLWQPHETVEVSVNLKLRQCAAGVRNCDEIAKILFLGMHFSFRCL